MIPKLITIDIETRPSPTALADFEPKFEPKEEPRPAVPRNLRDPAKIAAAELDVAERMEQWHLNRGKSLAEQAEQWEQDGCLRAERGEVLAIGYAINSAPVIMHAEQFGDGEIEMLSVFNGRLGDAVDEGLTVAGFNILDFDLPFIRRRCLILGIPFPLYNRDDKWKPWRFPHYDAMKDWQCGVYGARFVSLDHLMRALKVGKKTGDGGEFHNLYANPETRPQALQYLETDVLGADAVCRRMLA